MKFNLITIFPHCMDSYIAEGMVHRAIQDSIITLATHNLRDVTTDRHKTVDDRPYGGGAGMVLMAQPIIDTLKKLRLTKKTPGKKIVLLSARGKHWDQRLAKKYASLKEVTFICGRYEGVDERIKHVIDEEISLGDYVLTGGELGAAVMIDSITRLLPGVLGNSESPVQESHSQEGVLEYPQYTRPEVLTVNKKNYRVPKVLLSGNHAFIDEWRKQKSKRRM